MNLKITTAKIAALFLFIACQSDLKSPPNAPTTSKIIQVEYPETYELANIILALTEYGKTDPWEVRKDFEYYQKVQTYFEPVNNHPLLDSVNYSRAQWKHYLSFRTDAYAFAFQPDNSLKRMNEFYANEGVQPFDQHLALINDFVEKSKFRAFFAQHQDYYRQVKHKYKKTQYLKEMRAFLSAEFGDQVSSDRNYKVVLSPFVYRMNCHRDIDTTTTADFITIPNYVIADSVTPVAKDIASGIHNLFTEMDHGYVNPVTTNFAENINTHFKDSLWDNESGYGKNQHAVFNEYMTWAVYDIFLQKHFPNHAKTLGLNWSYQNESRGFPYAYAFTQKLVQLYEEKAAEETIKDLYPKLLDWTANTQHHLSKPMITVPKDSIALAFSNKTKINLQFSEPMAPVERVTTILQDGKGFKEFVELDAVNNQLQWSEDGLSLAFDIALPEGRDVYYLQFNWWGVAYPLISKKGILLTNGSYFKVNRE
jgi:hypothetical protein